MTVWSVRTHSMLVTYAKDYRYARFWSLLFSLIIPVSADFILSKWFQSRARVVHHLLFMCKRLSIQITMSNESRLGNALLDKAIDWPSGGSSTKEPARTPFEGIKKLGVGIYDVIYLVYDVFYPEQEGLRRQKTSIEGSILSSYSVRQTLMRRRMQHRFSRFVFVTIAQWSLADYVSNKTCLSIFSIGSLSTKRSW